MFKRVLFFVLVAFATIFFLPSASLAADKVVVKDSAYAATFVAQSVADPVRLEAGETKTINITFKNTGTIAWNGSGKRFISAFTMAPRYHESLFRGANWIDGKQTGKISGTVKPGETGILALQVTAPTTPGTYKEQFYLAAENYTWVKGGGFFIQFTVTPKAKQPESVPKSENTVEAPAEPETATQYLPHRFMLSPSEIVAKGGERVSITVAYQNLNDTPWQNYGFSVKSPTALASTQKMAIADDLWEGPTTILHKDQEVLSGGIVNETVTIRAPRKAGNYTADIQFEVNDTVVESSGLHIPINVTENAPDYVEGEDIGFVSAPRFAEEPRIRVGLWKVDNKEKQAIFVASEDEYGVYTGGEQVGNILLGATAVLGWNGNEYTLTSGDLNLVSPQYFRLEPVSNPHAVFTVANLNRKINWKGPSNFNKYRGIMEFRVTQDGKDIYVIEDVPFEDYIAGIGETSAIGPMEYIKAILVASRTYAYYTMAHTDKHDKRNFDVVAHTGDQLYLGVVSEEMMPRVVQAAQETRGYMVTYQGNIVITPYFGNSDGRTRAWTEVWGGTTKPWLVPVVATYDKRDHRKKYGHGVGMSARDAAIRAEEEGTGWADLLKYYYTGVEVERVYN